MKSDFSSWNHKPENHTILKAYAENAILEGVTKGQVPVVVWRDGEATLTLTPQDGEQIYDFKIENPLASLLSEEAKLTIEAYDKAVTEVEEETSEEE
jgi:hypothetical protein